MSRRLTSLLNRAWQSSAKVKPSPECVCFFTMRNKLRRNRKCRETSGASEEQTTDVLALALARSGCYNDKPQDLSSSSAQSVQEQGKICGVRFAPIFFQASLQTKRKRASFANPCQSEEKLQKPAPPGNHVSSSFQVAQTDEFVNVSNMGLVSPSPVHSCLLDIQTSNPAFPVQTVFSSLQRKTILQGTGSTGERRREERADVSERATKRPRCIPTVDGGIGSSQPSLTQQKRPRSSKLSRTHRLRQKSGDVTVNSDDSESARGSPVISDPLHGESSVEDVLWTDKYSPQHSSEVVCNSGSVTKLQKWLKKWKLRADSDERTMEESKGEDGNPGSWDCGDFQGEAVAENREDPLCNTMLITGPPGVGKTASVYACAQELGFKVFEVNCSSQRCGRHVLSQLREATQSHLVETSGIHPLKPAYFSNYNSSAKTETLPGKPLPAKSVTSTSNKTSRRPGRKSKSVPATVTLTNFFKMKAKADRLQDLSLVEKSERKTFSSAGCERTRSKKTAVSLILFEEVDIIFNDDVGFLGAIKTFMSTTKRPVILTTNDPLFRERFGCSLEEIIFKTPSAMSVCSYMQLLCLCENVRLDLDDVRSLLRQTGGDVRRCLLQLQLWVHSGGGRHGGARMRHAQSPSAAKDGGHSDSHLLPPRDSSCTAAMLGLQSVTITKLQDIMKRRHWSDSEANELLRLSVESWRQGEPLLYNNLDLLLPSGTSEQQPDEVTGSGLQRKLAGTDEEKVIPEVSVRNRPVKISRLSRRKSSTVLGTNSEITYRPKPQRTVSLLQDTGSRSSDRTEQLSGACLGALADFFDLMSYLDVTLPTASGSCGSETFVWTGVDIKEGLLDEKNEEEEEEEEGGGGHETQLYIKATAEGLGCHTCWWRMSQTWAEAQEHRETMESVKWTTLVERLRFSTTAGGRSLRFTSQTPCASRRSHRRFELSRKLLSSKSFSLLGNRRAVCVDYMPVLRSICRSHEAREQRDEPHGCVNYLQTKHQDLSKSVFLLLAEHFSHMNIQKL